MEDGPEGHRLQTFGQPDASLRRCAAELRQCDELRNTKDVFVEPGKDGGFPQEGYNS